MAKESKGKDKATAKKAEPKKSVGKVASPKMEIPANESQHVSVSIEKISNGYLIRQSRSGPEGWKENTVYSKTKPNVTLPDPKLSGAGKGKPKKGA